MKVLGIIPARGGSKGVPGKNILKFDGKPLITYAIEAGKKSRLLSELVVSTEEESIAAVARANCKVIKRSAELASDTSNVVGTVLNIIEKFEHENTFFDAVMLLQPTAPLRTTKDIDNAIELLKTKSVDAVISMVPVGDHHPARMYCKDSDQIKSLMPEFETGRRQELPQLFIRNGCIYLIKVNALKRERTFMPISKSAYFMDPEWAVNVDTEMDVLILEKLIVKWNNLKK